MINKLKQLKEQALQEFKNSSLLKELQVLGVKYLGRKGELTKVLRQVKDLSAEQRPKVGRLANEIKQELAATLKNLEFELKQRQHGLKEDFFDLTLPGQKFKQGHLHPQTIIQQQLEDIFVSMGFMVMDGPELESEYYNFEVLNIPATHPARDLQDTFYLKNKKGLVMRTHTSNQQVRAMEKFGAPLRVIFPGRCFRNEAVNASHDTAFYQLEGLMIDKDISISHLVAVMQAMLKSIFKKEVAVRLRPGYFPFVEPGFEVDVSCLICDGKGCNICKQTGWVEMIGSGLVHPHVLRAGGLDPKEWSGFAFGLGLTRLAMLKYGIDDIRLFLSGDLRFLEQF